MHRGAVIQDMQAVLLKVHDPLPIRSLDVRIPDIPLSRYGPVEDRSPSRYFRQLKLDLPLNQTQSLADSISGDASTDRVQVRGKSVELQADIRPVSLIEFLEQAHQTRRKFG
jgi:hypothetical protein